MRQHQFLRDARYATFQSTVGVDRFGYRSANRAPVDLDGVGDLTVSARGVERPLNGGLSVIGGAGRFVWHTPSFRGYLTLFGCDRQLLGVHLGQDRLPPSLLAREDLFDRAGLVIASVGPGRVAAGLHRLDRIEQ